HLPELRQHPPRPIGFRRIREHRLAGDAGGKRVGVHLRAALPGAHLLQLEHPRLEIRGDDGVLDLFGRRQDRRGDLVEATAEAGERAQMVIDRGAAEILEKIVVQMDAVETGLTWTRLLQVREEIVDEMGKWLRRIHAQSSVRSKPQWYNNPLPDVRDVVRRR